MIFDHLLDHQILTRLSSDSEGDRFLFVFAFQLQFLSWRIQREKKRRLRICVICCVGNGTSD